MAEKDGEGAGYRTLGQTTKIHAVTDLLGRPAVLRLTAGNVADGSMAGPLMIADKGHDENALRRRLHAEGAEAFIPGRCRSTTPRLATKRRWRIEAAYCRLKDFRRIATRYDKLARNFLSAVAFWI
jgi:transposase